MTSTPLISIVPDSIVRIPAMHSRSEVFPEPFGPTSARQSPLATLKLASFSVKLPNLAERFDTLSIAACLRTPFWKPTVSKS